MKLEQPATTSYSYIMQRHLFLSRCRALFSSSIREFFFIFDEMDLPAQRAVHRIVVFVIRVDIIISSLIFVLFFLVFVVVCLS